MENLVIVIGIVILLVVLYIAWRLATMRRGLDQEALASAVGTSLRDSLEIFKGAFATSLKELGLGEDIGAIKKTADEVLRSSQDLQNLFEVKRGRAEFGEFQLEELLKDILPKEKFEIRKEIPGLGIPDAHIKSTEGIICIDSKFPLENYRRLVGTSDESEKKRYAREFRRDVEGHITDIADKYVKQEEGTVPFAYGFIPSEAVYQYLTEAEFGLLRDAASRGVNLVSPATLVINLNLIRIGIRAREITERAEEIEKNLQVLKSSFDGFEREWSTLKSHIANAYTKFSDADKKYVELKGNYNRIARLEEIGEKEKKEE